MIFNTPSACGGVIPLNRGPGLALGFNTFYSIIFFSASISLFQLGIGEQIGAAVFIIAFGATALALALAFGLGGRDAAAEYLKK